MLKHQRQAFSGLDAMGGQDVSDVAAISGYFLDNTLV